MKKRISAVLALVIVLSQTSVFAMQKSESIAGNYDEYVLTENENVELFETYSDFKYSVNNDEDTVTITDYIGEGKEVEIPSEINGKKVTKIDNKAFWYYYGLKSVTIPDSVEEIGEYAFYGCSGLESVTIGKGVKTIVHSAFYSCVSLKSVTIPDSVQTIGNYAFNNCSSLESITIPDSVKEIGDGAFDNCRSLESITIPDSVEKIGSYAFDGTALYENQENWENYFLYINNHLIKALPNIDDECKIKDGTVTIADYAFDSCGSLTSVTIPDSVKTIGDSAFKYCESLTSVTIPDSVKTIGENTFNNCSGLTSVTIPDSVKEIGSNAFNGCSSLESVTISDNVRAIGSSAFANTALYTNQENWENDVLYIGNHLIAAQYTIDGEYTIKDGTVTIADFAFDSHRNLESVIIPDSVKTIGIYAFRDCVELESATIGNGVEEIGECAFSGCETLTSLTMGESIREIGDNAFESCEQLTSVTIPDSVKTIGDEAFYYCKGLTSLTIGSGVEEIGEYAFYNCRKLTSVTIPDSVKKIGYCVFGNCIKLENINVSANNENYTSQDGVMFNKDKTKLIQYPLGNTNTEYEIPDSVKTIGGRAFDNCSGLKNVTIPDGVKEIGSSAFTKCDSLENINVSANNENYTSQDGVLFNKDKTELIQYPIGNARTEYEIPVGVEEIGYGAFEYGKSLTSVTIPDSVKIIAKYAFYYCDKLTSLIIGNSVEGIGYCAFMSCSGLKSVTIPESVEEIGYRAFEYCDSLESAVFLGKKTGFDDDDVFDYCDNLTIYGYAGSNAKEYAEENDIPFVEISNPTFGNVTIEKPAANYSDNKVTTTVSISNENGGPFTLYVVGYNADNAIVGFKSISVTKSYEDSIKFDANEKPEYVKVFAFDAINDVSPLCKPEQAKVE